MPVTYRQQQIEIQTPADAEAWASQFGVSVNDLISAVSAVGTSLEDLRAYLRSAQEPMGAFVDRMRSRMDEIEIQFEKLTEERRSIVAFLEGFAQLQRTQQQSGRALALAFSTGGQPELPPFEDRGFFEDLTFGASRQAVSSGSSASVLDVVFQLLWDGKRRTVHDILSFLEIRGVPIKAANPAGFLSTLLSRDPRFDASRRDGWGVAAAYR